MVILFQRLHLHTDLRTHSTQTLRAYRNATSVFSNEWCALMRNHLSHHRLVNNEVNLKTYYDIQPERKPALKPESNSAIRKSIKTNITPIINAAKARNYSILIGRLQFLGTLYYSFLISSSSKNGAH